MKNNTKGRHDRFDPKTSTVHDTPNCQGPRTETKPDHDADTTEVMKGFTAGVITDCLKLNIRKEPSADAEILATIDALSPVMVDMDASTNDFYRVCTAAGIEGFSMRKYIALKK